MSKKLKLWNGRWFDFKSHVFVAAYSQKEAIELLNNTGSKFMNLYQLKTYFSECWGTRMSGITPERGVWLEDFKPPREIKRIL
jgi:hypothetical protein